MDKQYLSGFKLGTSEKGWVLDDIRLKAVEPMQLAFLESLSAPWKQPNLIQSPT
jgi:hypothetical protein